MPTKKSKKAAAKKAAPKKRSQAMMTYETQEEDNEQNATPETAAPVEGEEVPHLSTLDPHALVDMRIRQDLSNMGDAQLMPTSDPNIKYIKRPGKPIPTKEQAEPTS